MARTHLAAAVAAVTLFSSVALAHFDEEQMPQSYRQSYFALLAANFGPMAATVKGDIPWDQKAMEGWAHDLAALSTLNVLRGFPDGSDTGTTRAKPELWQNKADFESKLQDLDEALVALEKTTGGGDKKAIAAAVGDAGKACKACHDEYKAENYLN